MADNDYIE